MYKEALKQQKIICIPPDNQVKYFLDINSKNMNKIIKFISMYTLVNFAMTNLESHLLSKSPYFVGQMVTETGTNIIEVTENDQRNLVIQKGKL